ncbi:hypothetical protein OG599_08915 [Streptomyces sp. NBC_01335]|uniref:hypothetical protein n=1 Tax=Streptomyces sp. NBC_01335 TaxID=2903828 RepID=UPI002E0FD9AD|nr:hypothetical protein OG599_08915 [Streptomyces sp. NBC_01335]
MTDTPHSDVQDLRALASSIDALRGRLPVVGDLHRAPDRATVGQQISDLGKLITHLGDKLVAAPLGGTDTSVPDALYTAGEATSALGNLASQLAFLNETEPQREQPDFREARQDALAAIENSIETADTSLRQTAKILVLSAQLKAARSRSTTTATAALPLSQAPATPPAAPHSRPTRSR